MDVIRIEICRNMTDSKENKYRMTDGVDMTIRYIRDIKTSYEYLTSVSHRHAGLSNSIYK